VAGETLRTGQELLASFPDNQAGLIDAVQARDFVISAASGVIFVEDDPLDVPFTLPMTAGVPVQFLLSYPGTALAVSNFYTLDGNGQIIPDYVGLGINVPAGVIRLHVGSVLLNCEKAGGGTAEFEFQGTQGGVFTGEPLSREIGTTPQGFGFAGDRLYDVSLAEPVDFSITPIGHSDDLIINDFRIKMESVLI
jgi:hypothetical protein